MKNLCKYPVILSVSQIKAADIIGEMVKNPGQVELLIKERT